MFDIPPSVTIENCLLYVLFMSLLYGYLEEYQRRILDRINKVGDFGRNLANEFYNYLSKKTEDQVEIIKENTDDVKIRIDSLESAFKNLVINESLLLEEQLKDLQILKQNAWTTKSKEKYIKIERATSRRKSIYSAAQTFAEAAKEKKLLEEP
jgi:hypothetical protein